MGRAAVFKADGCEFESRRVLFTNGKRALTEGALSPNATSDLRSPVPGPVSWSDFSRHSRCQVAEESRLAVALLDYFDLANRGRSSDGLQCLDRGAGTGHQAEIVGPEFGRHVGVGVMACIAQ